jgi:hypothetical protein
MDQPMLTLKRLKDFESRLRYGAEEIIEETLRTLFWPTVMLLDAIKLKRPPSI